MEFYIHNITRYNDGIDVKSLIPDANMRRRMSSFLKMGVSTAIKCLQESAEAGVDGIITSTWLGCLSDSEKFLSSIISNGEQLLNPTPFIQSTANTIGGLIALMTGNHCYNNTYTDKENGLQNAILDAMMSISEKGSGRFLVGEINGDPSFLTEISGTHEGSLFMIISDRPSEESYGPYTFENVSEIVKLAKECQ